MSAHAIDRDTVLPHIYGEVASGRSLDSVLRQDEGMPSPATFWRWHMADAEIRDNLARARENGVEIIMDECLEIADDESDEDTGVTVQRAKLRVETRLKYAQMIAPRKYGPRVDHVSSDGSMTPPQSLSAFYGGNETEEV
jgi:hypothetical protein